MKSVANCENFFRSRLQHFMQAVQFTSVSYCTRRLLTHFSCRSFRMMRTTDDLGTPVFRDISWTVLWVQGWSSWLRTRSFTWSVFSSVRALRGLSLPWCLSTVPMSLNFLSNLLVLLVVHPLSGNSVLTCLVLYPFNWYKFFIRILSSSLKTIFTKNPVMLWRLGYCSKQVIAKINK